MKLKSLAILSLLLLTAVSASAQEATLNAPVARPSESKLTVKRLDLTANQAVISLSVQSSASEEIRYYNLVVPDPSPATASATVSGLVTAIDTARPTETGGVLRRLNFRILGYLFDQGYLPAATLNP